MKKLFVFIIFALSIFLVFSATGCTEKQDGTVTHSFSVSHQSATLEVGETLQLSAYYGKEKITYKILDSSVAEISENGLITAKALGQTTVEILAGKEKRSCKVSVVHFDYSVQIDKDGTIYAYVGSFVDFTAQSYKDGVLYNGKITWSANSSNVILMKNGNKLTFSSTIVGEYVITATGDKGQTDTVTVKVIQSTESLE